MDRLRRWRTSKRTPTLLVSNPMAPIAEVDRRHGAAHLEQLEEILGFGVDESAANHRVRAQAPARSRPGGNDSTTLPVRSVT